MADPAYIVDGVLTDGEAWVGIATTTLGSDTATITFTSTDDGQVGDFSQYMDLVLIIYVQTASSSDCRMNLNNDTASNYALQELYGDGSSAGAYANAALGYAKLGIVPETSDGANDFAAIVAHLFDINSGKYKSAISQYADDEDGNGYVGLQAHTWKSQAAISEIDLSSGSDLKAGSSFSLFGVLPRMVA